jgi:hypothetical protein
VENCCGNQCLPSRHHSPVRDAGMQTNATLTHTHSFICSNIQFGPFLFITGIFQKIHRALYKHTFNTVKLFTIRGCIQKFPDWPPGVRTANDTALCHQVQLYRYFVSQSSEFCRHNSLCCFSTSVYCCYYFVKTQSGNFWIHHRKTLGLVKCL